jgi:hypothetical protein
MSPKPDRIPLARQPAPPAEPYTHDLRPQIKPAHVGEPQGELARTRAADGRNAPLQAMRHFIIALGIC